NSPPPPSYCSQRRFLGRRRHIRPPLGVAPVPKEPCHPPLSIPTNLSHRNHLCSPENAKIRPNLTQNSRSSISLLRPPFLAIKDTTKS
ncbi:AP2/B3-like transcriptional factor family protein, partial [Prunus dulcis]